MREILFRGKAKTIRRGEWIEGSLVNTYDWYTREQHCFIVDDDYEDHDEWEVDPETVGQYTGLNDSTGKMIFEGDIVQYKNSIEQAKGLVEFEGCRFYFKWIDITEPNGALYFFQCEKELEIIGNRFDNPELLVKE